MPRIINYKQQQQSSLVFRGECKKIPHFIMKNKHQVHADDFRCPL